MEAGKLDPTLVQRTLKQVYRLFRVGTFHQINNDAIRTVVDETRGILEEIRREDVKELTLLFDGETVLVNSQMLRASREIYETSREFGTFLEGRNVNLLSLSTSATSQDLQELVAFFLNPNLQPTAEGEFRLSERVALRRVDPGMLVGFEDEGLHPVERVLLVYALTVLVLRRLHESVLAGEYSLAGYFKRLARQLAQINYAERPVVLDVILSSHLSSDDAKRTANAAVIAAAMVRQTGVSEATTARVVMTTLMSAAGTARQRSNYFDGHDPLSALLAPFTETDRQQEPDASATAVVRLGTLRGEAALRAIVVRDARARLAGSADGGWNTLFESRIVATARRFVDELTGADAEARSPALVVEKLRGRATDALDHICLDLLVNGIRLYPAGTAVELTSGWSGIVLEAPAKPSEFDRPRLLLCHGPGGAASELREMDLRDRNESALGTIRRVMEQASPVMEEQRLARLGDRWRGAERNGSIAVWRQAMAEQRATLASMRDALSQETDAEATARDQARRADAEVFANVAADAGRRKFGLLTPINKGAAHLSVRGTTAFLKIGATDPRLTPTQAEPVLAAGGLRSTGAFAVVGTGAHEAVGGDGRAVRDSGSFASVRSTGSLPAVRESSGAHRALEARQTGGFAAVGAMPSDPLGSASHASVRSTGSLPRITAAQASGAHHVVPEPAQAASEPSPISPAAAEPDAFAVAPKEQPQPQQTEQVSAAERIRRRLGQTGPIAVTASFTGSAQGEALPSVASDASATAAIPPGLDPDSVVRVEPERATAAEPPAPRASATILKKYARRTDPAPTPVVAPTPEAEAPADLDSLLADYLGDKKD